MAYQELHTLGDGRDMNEKVNVSVHLRIMMAHGKRVCVSSCMGVVCWGRGQRLGNVGTLFT